MSVAENMSKPLAMVTGASSGIGEAYARKLAELGYDLLILARRKNRLEELASELNEKYSCQVEVAVADLSKPTDLKKVVKELEERDVSFLVNNAGFGIGKDFHEIGYAELQDMIQVHVTATTFLCRAVLKKMMEKNEGIIVNVASVAAFVQLPGSSTYPGTKAFMTAFSKSLQRNLEGTKIKIQALCPGYTETEFHNSAVYNKVKPASPKILWMTAERVVYLSLKALHSKKVVYVPGILYRLIIFLLDFPLTAPFLWAYHRRRTQSK